MKRLNTQEQEALRHLETTLRKNFSAHDLLGESSEIEPSDWFIGPKGSSVEPLRHALNTALAQHIHARREYFPDDPPLRRQVHESLDWENPDRPSDELSNSLVNVLTRKTHELTEALKGSIPLASYRNQSHMYWDVSVPSIVGYFAGMLYNQNNVAAEASPVTTMIEMIVGHSLCQLIGFPTHVPAKPTDAWGHITCDGSVANIEAMWAARNLKYLPMAFAEAIKNESSLSSARSFTVNLPNGVVKPLISLSPWQLLNLSVDETLAIEPRLLKETFAEKLDLEMVLARYSIQSLGVVEFTRRFLPDRQHAQPIIIVPQTAHYSWKKSVTLLGLGFDSIQPARVDLDGRLDTRYLRQLLNNALEENRPVIQLVGIVGSTEESAVDPIDEILEIRSQMRARGLEFYFHIDGAWGGYFTTMLTSPEDGIDDENESQSQPMACFASPYVQTQLKSLRYADSITLDPHKSGFVPYAAGCLCYRNGDARNIISIQAPVVFHGGQDQNVGLYGVEGSKPGAAACSVFLSHDVIGLHNKGYGQLLNQCIFANKLFYVGLISLFSATDDLTLTAFQRLPSEKDSSATKHEIEAEKQYAQQTFANVLPGEMEALILKQDKTPKEQRRCELFQAISGDLSIVNYALNFKINGVVNKSMALFNELNDHLFSQLSLHLEEVHEAKVPTAPLILTSSEFNDQGYSTELMQSFASRCGVTLTHPATLKFLISTTQNPWLTDTEQGSFIPELMRELKKAAESSRQFLIDRYGIAELTARSQQS